jgi:transcriptional regulator with XRE-family HTH domain/mannose-6-phosphate isomerase-like protein (cupin superfamily)
VSEPTRNPAPDEPAVEGEPSGEPSAGAAPQATPAAVGQRLRDERQRQRIGLRELARRVGVSASLISQIELGRATPSVGTLYAIVNELDMSLDELFFRATGGSGRAPRDAGTPDAPVSDPGHPPAREDGAGAASATRVSTGPVVRAADRKTIHLGSGVTWEQMSPHSDMGVDFLYVVYEVGGASAPERSLIRHGGREFGHLLEGRLSVTVGFETYELYPGDAISFDSSIPHRLFNSGEAPARAIWCVVGRDDPRFTHAAVAALTGGGAAPAQ